MGITKDEALKIVTAFEETADYIDTDDHSHGVLSTALTDLAARLADVLGVPLCACRWGHDEMHGNRDCPRRDFAGAQ